MSFLKNLRGSVTRKNNSAENNNLQRNSSVSASTRKSVQIIKNSDRNESKGVIRSETFTIENHESIFSRNKTFIRSSMFGRFSTFGKKKKVAKQRTEELKAQDDELSNSYKRYPTPSDVVATGGDPFNYLYQQGGNGAITKSENNKNIAERGSVEYGTYRKSKLSPQAKEQLEELSSETANTKQGRKDSDKFKTVTISSFRKSFREKFLNQKRDVPYNPSWFVEVEAPKKSENDNDERKSRRPDLLVFENEQYRPTARSPIRRDAKSPCRSESRPTPTIKRNETFKIERDQQPSIRIEIKNSITPNEPGRIVPVGVAKPMQSSNQNESNSKIIQKTWLENGHNPSTGQKMYQTTIQITDEMVNTNYRNGGQGSDIRNRIQSPQSRMRNQNKQNSSEIFISNYSPLKSYELVTNMRRRTDPSPNRIKDGQKSLQEHRNQGAIQSYGGKKWSQAPTFSSQQKVSSHVTDKLVRKDATNRNLTANTRRAVAKSPWR